MLKIGSSGLLFLLLIFQQNKRSEVKIKQGERKPEWLKLVRVSALLLVLILDFR